MESSNRIGKSFNTSYQLRNYSSAMESALELAEIGIYQSYPLLEEIYCNEFFRKHFNITATTPHEIYAEFLSNLHPDDRQYIDFAQKMLQNGSKQLTEDEKSWKLILRTHQKDNSDKHIQIIVDAEYWKPEENNLFFHGISQPASPEECKQVHDRPSALLKAQKVLHLLPETVIIVSRNLKVLDILSHRDRVTQNKELAIGQTAMESFQSIFNQQQIPFAKEIIESILDTQEEYRFKFSMTVKGSLEHYSCYGLPYDDNSAIIFYQNVSEVENTQKELRSNQGMLSFALKTANIKAFSFTFPQQPVLQQGYINLYGLDEKGQIAVRTLNWSDFLHYINPEDAIKQQTIYDRLARKEITEFKTELRIHLDAEEYWAEFTGAVHEVDADGNPSSLIGCYIDIQERKQHEGDLIRAREKAELADSMKSTYLANMSHEIRTPLNAIVGFSELLSYAEDAEEKQTYIDIIKANNDQLLHLIADIIDVSKIEAGILSVNYQKIELNELMDEIYHTIRLKITDGIVFTVEKDRDSFLFNIDKSRLNQVITNLLNNAIKYTETGSICYGYKIKNKNIYFFVKDTGAGIPEEKMESIFARHVMLGQKKESFGLGLAISKGIVEKFGGELSVASTVGQGSTFSFNIPI